MIVMIVGASGFIGGRLAQAFAAAGHEVVCAGRARPGPDRARLPAGCARAVTIDYTAPMATDWTPLLAGVDVLVNAVGILRESGHQTFDHLHVLGPRALFTAAALASVRRVIQVSALGAEAGAVARYHASKHEADRFLMQLPLDWAIVQPSLVYGAGGTSATLFDSLASLPLVPLPGRGEQRVQPVHIDDLVDAVLRLAESPAALRCVLPVVGPSELTLREFLAELRGTLGLGRARFVPVPRAWVSLAARAGESIPSLLLDRETFGMLERGNTGPPGPLQRLLGRPPTPVAGFVSPARRGSRRTAASLRWLAPLLRLAVASMWLLAGIVALGPYPVQDSLALLRSIGVSAELAPLLLFGSAALDILLGVLTLLPRRPRILWPAQIALVLVYTLIISIALPGLWLEPFGPVAKNIPILALLILLHQLEERR
jgi:uncharacterized protein YbjT (DUF2867 family)/uncharacterized membrane protein YphA (DoxX/SURF4 family)